MITYVLGAPGAGNTELVPLLKPLLPGHVVLDWDALMPAAGLLAGRPSGRARGRGLLTASLSGRW